MSTEAEIQLLKAAEKGDISGVEIALANGTDINTKNDYNDTALNLAAEYGHIEIVKLLVEKGADINNKGGADKTPLMNATLLISPSANHDRIVRYLIDKGAIVTNELLSAVQLKVNILSENAKTGMVLPQAVDAWQGFLNYLIAAKIKQNLPKVMELLADTSVENRKNAIRDIQRAVWQGMDISPALPLVTKLLVDEDKDVRYYAGTSMTTWAVQNNDWTKIGELAEKNDYDVKEGVTYILSTYSIQGKDVSPAIPTLEKLLDEKNDIIQHDALITFGYLVQNNGTDVSSVLPAVTKLLEDPSARVRIGAVWIVYQVANKGRDISTAVPQLERLAADPEPKVKEIAEKTLVILKEKK